MEVRSQDERDFHAFVLMPFDPEFEDIYSDLIARTLESEGFTVERADSSLDQENVLKDIIHGIARAHLVVAELTGMNPNVLYELGIAHALGKPTVLLTQAVEEVPFDLRSYRMIVYSVHYAEAKALRDRLGDIARRLRERSIRFGNPVTDFASGLIRMPEPVEPLEGLARAYFEARLAARPARDIPCPDCDTATMEDGAVLAPILERIAELFARAVQYEALLIFEDECSGNLLITLESLWRSMGAVSATPHRRAV